MPELKHLRPSEPDITELKQAAVALKDSNRALASAKKSADAAKIVFATWLKKERGIDLDALAIGDAVCIDEVLLVTIEARNSFDEQDFLKEHPALHAQFKKDFVVKKFKPLTS